MASDLDQLVDMGFDKDRAELAVKQTGGRRFCLAFYPQLRLTKFYSSWGVGLVGE